MFHFYNKISRLFPLGMIGIVCFAYINLHSYVCHQVKKDNFANISSKHTIEKTRERLLSQKLIVPNAVFYVWCSGSKKRFFEFRHYLSVMSVIRYLEPTFIGFYYDKYPAIDKESYYTWIRDLEHNYYSFHTFQMEPNKGCTADAEINISYAMELLKKDGGIFLKEYIVLANPVSFVQYMQQHTHTFRTDGGKIDMILRSKQSVSIDEHNQYLDGRNSCLSSYVMNNQSFSVMDRPLCVALERRFYPKDIWILNNPFGQLIREIAYGDSRIVKPSGEYANLIPNVAHMVWLRGGEMSFLFYLSMLSLLFIQEVEDIYLHGDLPPTGFYWDMIRNNSKVHFIQQVYSPIIFSHEIRGTNKYKYISDVWRVNIMQKYGGLYFDVDTIILKPLGVEIRYYDAVIGIDVGSGYHHPFPSTFNNGVLLGKPDKMFWNLFIQSMNNFHEEKNCYNGCQESYKIKERHPEVVHIEPHLQVMCFSHTCYPKWGANNWKPRTKLKEVILGTHIMHFSHPTPAEFKSHESLLNSYKTNIYSEIGFHVLEKSGLLNDFMKLQKRN